MESKLLAFLGARGQASLAASPAQLACVLAAMGIFYLVSKAVYRVYFGPLSHIPGPKLNALTMIPSARHLLAGTIAENTLQLHRTYGHVVKISPNEVSFTSAETAFPDIYGFRTGPRKGRPNMDKDPAWYTKPSNSVPSILQANDADHGRGRRVLANAFSDKAVMAQEPLVQNYADQLISGMKRAAAAADGGVVNTVEWFEWTTFDIIADLTFGEPFGCLQTASTHKYVHLLLESAKSLRYYYVLAVFPWLKYLGNLVIDHDLVAKRREFQGWVASQVQKRIEQGETVRPDFMTLLLANNKGTEASTLSRGEINSNAALMLNAGTETTATLLNGAVWHILRSPIVYRRLQNELRAKFARYEDITLSGVNSAPYLCAVISETLRVFPAAAAGFGRVVPRGGEFISRTFVPKGTVVSVSQYAAYRSEENFTNPEAFAPERWLVLLGDPAYAGDKRAAHQPFNYGPRSCLGRNLAYAEARLILAKVFWTFDMEFEDDSDARTWLERCKVMRFWVKPRLAVRLTVHEGAP
ncbi:benzoate 4-monooxygenase cytochrome P450 [Coniella lustricola]|uniref:Benzoate 4-monooxygenase cytochrome P450 n=1 Tax=Coniella lustricola TaxID=2025994 RepID=A0A2T3A6E5_9PEZI|nr:benzoate 4-monooxygenase cytochrome P450 [Coniella lustricola]